MTTEVRAIVDLEAGARESVRIPGPHPEAAPRERSPRRACPEPAEGRIQLAPPLGLPEMSFETRRPRLRSSGRGRGRQLRSWLRVAGAIHPADFIHWRRVGSRAAWLHAPRGPDRRAPSLA